MLRRSWSAGILVHETGEKLNGLTSVLHRRENLCQKEQDCYALPLSTFRPSIAQGRIDQAQGTRQGPSA